LDDHDSDDELAAAPAEESMLDSEEESISETDSDESRSPSPLAGKGKVQKVIREPVPRGLPSLPLPPGYDDDERDAEEDITEDGSEESQSDEDDDEDEEIEEHDSTDGDGDTDEDEWVPPAKTVRDSSSHTPGRKAAKPIAKPSSSTAKMSKLRREMDSLSLSSVADDSMEIVPKGTINKKRLVVFLGHDFPSFPLILA
jgi:hypothetical protein